MGLRVEDFMRNRVMDNRCFMLSSNVLSTISRISANQMPRCVPSRVDKSDKPEPAVCALNSNGTTYSEPD
jgi:hypothetical protein